MKNMNVLTWWCLAFIPFTWNNGHGKLIEPPSRASDHELSCGGFSRQWHINKGRCGICGDPWDAKTPRDHELGGQFGRGEVVRRYSPQDTITVKVELPANQNGYIELRLCDEPSESSQDCFDKNVLKLDGTDSTKFYPKDGNTSYEMKYPLPEDLECVHCVLQYRYLAANNLEDCENGTEFVGCGHQEEFRACADIAIGYVSTESLCYLVVVVIVPLFLTIGFLAGMYLYRYREIVIKSFQKSKAAPLVPVRLPRQESVTV